MNAIIEFVSFIPYLFYGSMAFILYGSVILAVVAFIYLLILGFRRKDDVDDVDFDANDIEHQHRLNKYRTTHVGDSDND